MTSFRVLVLCTGNSARSQIGETLWGLPDPADETEPNVARATFDATCMALSDRVDALLALPLESMSPRDLTIAAQAIHDVRS